MDDLVKRLKLIAAWHLPGGPTPKEERPSIHKVCTKAADALTAQAQRIAELEGENVRLRIGNLTLRPGHNPGTIFIEQASGEGGEFPINEVETVLQAYYAENF